MDGMDSVDIWRGCRPGHEVGLFADAVELKSGQTVAELGSGVGALALTLAARYFATPSIESDYR
jgi:tRNA1(Val) A37 N6-methylase TrmN6